MASFHQAMILLLGIVTWQFVLLEAEPVGCVTDACYCFPDGDIECSEQEMTRIPSFKRMSSGVYGNASIVYTKIDLSMNKIHKIGPHAFRNLSVKTIKIHRNRGLMKLNGRSFRGLENTLQSIVITKCNVSELPSGLFKDLRELRTIDMSDSHIRVIERGVFRGASNLHTLNLEGNRLTTLGEYAFSGLANLKTLQLGKNSLNLIDTKALSALISLETLDLRGNQLRDLQPRGFGRLEKLRRLDLSNNLLPALFPQMFQGLKQLETLILPRNSIAFIARGTFVGLSNVKELMLGKNKLTSIKPGTFEGLVNLRSLYVNDNHIRELTDGVFKGLKNLRKVQLDYNQLTTINACAFNDPAAIGDLLLTGNPIHCDCAVAWTAFSPSTSSSSAAGGSSGSTRQHNVIGICHSPAVAQGKSISDGEKYHVCRNTGVEHCFGDGNRDRSVNATLVQQTLPTSRRYKRVMYG